MTTSTDFKQESQHINTADYEETIVTANVSVGIDNLRQPQTLLNDEPSLTENAQATDVNTDLVTDLEDYLWEQEIDRLAATENYSSWVSLDQILSLEEIRPYVSDDVYQQMLSQITSTGDEYFGTDELWSRIATMPEDISHELFEVMSSLDTH